MAALFEGIHDISEGEGASANFGHKLVDVSLCPSPRRGLFPVTGKFVVVGAQKVSVLLPLGLQKDGILTVEFSYPSNVIEKPGIAGEVYGEKQRFRPIGR